MLRRALPYASSEDNAGNGLNEILAGITTFTHRPQLPSHRQNESSFYFSPSSLLVCGTTALSLALPTELFPGAVPAIWSISTGIAGCHSPVRCRADQKRFSDPERIREWKEVDLAGNAATTQKPQAGHRAHQSYFTGTKIPISIGRA